MGGGSGKVYINKEEKLLGSNRKSKNNIRQPVLTHKSRMGLVAAFSCDLNDRVSL